MLDKQVFELINQEIKSENDADVKIEDHIELYPSLQFIMYVNYNLQDLSCCFYGCKVIQKVIEMVPFRLLKTNLIATIKTLFYTLSLQN